VGVFFRIDLQVTWVAGALALALMAGGCTGTAAPQGAEPSASRATLAPVLPLASTEADLAVDRGLATALDKEFAADE
jgi:hypothetical protein